MPKKLSVVVVSLTPFDDQLKLDEPAFRSHLRRLKEARVCVYVGGSGSGEGYSLSVADRDRVLAIAVEELNGHVPCRAMGCEPRTADEMVEFLRAAERSGVDAAQIFSLDIGHGSKPSIAELEQYYNTAIGSVSLPVYLSSHHAAGYYVPPALIEKLANRFPNLVGIAYGGPSIPYLAELIERLGDRMEVHCAGPGNGLSVLAMGGNGFMGGEGNLTPRLVQSVIDGWSSGDYDKARLSFLKLMEFERAYTLYNGGSSMRSMKPLMNKFGLPAGKLRAPRLPISDTELNDLHAAVMRMELPI
ncbi:MAG: dihydrodipicolinate synthase family protein [Phyllobacterium sp.]